MSAQSAIAVLCGGSTEADLRQSPLPVDIIELAQCRSRVAAGSAALAHGSLYRIALARGIDAAVDAFIDTLVRLEAELCDDQGLTIAHIRHSLRDQSKILLSIDLCIAKIHAAKMDSGSMIDLLHAQVQSGDPSMASTYSSLLRYTLQPFFAHLTHWMAFGELDASAYGIFFVCDRTIDRHGQESDMRRQTTDRGFERLPGSSSNGLPLHQSLREHEWSHGFSVEGRLVPSSILSALCAQQVLDTGIAVRLLREHGEDLQDSFASGDFADAHHSHGQLAYLPGQDGPASMGAREGTGDPRGRSGATVPLEGPSTVTRADSLAISRLLATFRHAPETSRLAFEVVVARIRAGVHARLWRLLVRDGSLLAHSRAVRDYVLMGRGDLFQAFLEHGRPMMNALPAHAPNALQQLTRGPWAAAVHASTPLVQDEPQYSLGESGLHGSASHLGSSGLMQSHQGPAVYRSGHVQEASGGVEQALLARCSLTLLHRSVRWQMRAGDAWQQPGPGPQSLSPSSILSSWWPASDTRADASWREPRVDVQLLARGAAKSCPLARVDLPGSISRPLLAPLGPANAPTSGAAWLGQPVSVTQGFMLRLGVNLLSPQVSEGDGGKLGSTPSFAVVLQRSGPLCLGSAHVALPGASPSGPVVPCAGYEGIDNSVVIHVIAKRLAVPAGTAPPPQIAPPSGAGTAAPARYRVVVAVYGPQRGLPVSSNGTTSQDGRPLLGSGAVMEQWLPAVELFAGPNGAPFESHPLHLAIEYSPPDAAASAQGELEEAVPLTGRLRVTSLDVAAAVGSARPAGTGLVAPSAAAFTAASTVVVDAPLALEKQINFLPGPSGSAGGGPGRGRVWVGCTAESQPGLPVTTSALVYLDASSYSEADSGYGSLAVAYDVPWPLHVIWDSSALSLCHDVFRFALRARGLSLALQDVWKALMESFSHDVQPAAVPGAHQSASRGGRRRPGLRAAGTLDASIAAASLLDTTHMSSATATVDGVSAQLTGTGGKRAADPAVYARARARVGVHSLLRPVWLLRARMALVVDALLGHLQVDIISAVHARFEEDVAASGDYAALRRAHARFLSSLATGCFLSAQSVMLVVERLLAHVGRFTAMVALRAPAGELPALVAPQHDREAVVELAGAFDSDSHLLEATLRAAGGGLETGSLLTRLAFKDGGV